ncbi:uncharacterized protein LOC125061092 isoform X1 [Pieris napi]|uniref:uncharacterized protein LOC125061092 isoform X1 n=1 Tax=Pieris napi TaxID=78633 RepID=UPI001FBB9E73|nr:uncharacterized protein LOC125061092 isoform X1 [Pieris napi]
MDNDGRKCRKTKLVPREVNESDEEIFALQSVVESTLARIKRPCKKALPVVAIATQSSQTNTNSIRENPGRSNTMPMNFDIKIEVENVDENAIEKQHEIISWREIVKKSNEIYLQSNNICDKILHGQVLNTCKPDVKVFVKTPHEKLLDRVFTRWCDWASLTEEPKDPPLFYKCYICDMAWWHLADFRDHIRTHEPSSLRVVLEMNDYVECNIVAYYSKSANKYIANIEGKCWKCGENAFEHTKLKNCVGCKKRFYTCSKLRQHQWYCEGFKKMHLELFASAEKIFKCHLCRFYFFKKEDSIEHMILRHSVRSDVPIPGCAVCEKCKDLISYEDDHVCESKRYVTTCGACKKRVTESSAAFHQIEGNVTCSVCKLKIVNSCSTHLHALRHTMNYGLAYKCLTCNFFIIFDLEQIQKHKMFYHSNRDFDYDLISVPKTIVDRLKSTPAKHDSTVDSPINTLLLPNDTQDMVNDIDDDDDVIIIDDVPEVIVIPSDDTPNDDLPCVIANIKSEPLEIELQTSKTKHTVTPQNVFECKTMEIQIPKDTKDLLDCHSDGNRISDDEVICIDEIKREPNSEVAVESTHNNLNKTTTHRRTQYVHGKATSNTQIVKATPEDIAKSLINIKKSMDITYKEMEFMKKYINHSSTNQTEVDIERMLPSAFVKTKCSESPEVIQKIQKPNKIKKLRQYRPKIKQTVLTDASRHSESDVKIEVIKSVDVVEKEKLITVDLSDTQLNEQKREEGRPADISNNLEQITPKESEVSEPLKVEKLVDTVVEIDIPWDAVPIKEEADPEMDLKLSDIRRIYHIDVNVGENEIDVKREINEFDLTGQSENWHQDNSAYNSQHSSDDEFENDLITISPNETLNTDEDSDHERKRTHRKKGKLYSCIRCNFKGVHRLYKQHKRYECQKAIHLYDYHCSLCKNSFDSMHTYLLHFEKHGVPELICPQCGHGGISMKSLSLHVKMHIKSLFVSYRSFHSDDTITAPVLKCKVCDAHVTRPDFIKHWDTHLDLNNLKRRLKSPEMLLPQLPHGFQTLDHDDTPDIKKALSLFMNPEKLMDVERKNFRVCILCERYFNRRNDCKRHLIEHFLKNAYSTKTRCNGLKCQICGDVFEKIDMFRGHMRLHACLPVYKCEICDRTFSDSSNFSKHKKVHNFQILICDICKKKFTNKAYLTKHIKDHEKTPIIKCDKCKKIFVCKSAYKKHYRTNHSMYSRFRCQECRQHFSTTREKWDHMWNVHREREVQADCHLCDAKYRKKSDLKRHFASMHKSKAPDITNADSEDVDVIKSEPE